MIVRLAILTLLSVSAWGASFQASGNYCSNGGCHLEWTADGTADTWVEWGTTTAAADAATPVIGRELTGSDRYNNVHGLPEASTVYLKVCEDANANATCDAGEWIACSDTSDLVTGLLLCGGSGEPPYVETGAYTAETPTAPVHTFDGSSLPTIDSNGQVTSCAEVRSRIAAILAAIEAGPGSPTVYGMEVTADIGRCQPTAAEQWSLKASGAAAGGHVIVLYDQAALAPGPETEEPRLTLVASGADLTWLTERGNEGYVLGGCNTDASSLCAELWIDGIGVEAPTRAETGYEQTTVSSISSGTITTAAAHGIGLQGRFSIDSDDPDCRIDGLNWKTTNSASGSSLPLANTPSITDEADCAGDVITLAVGWFLGGCSSTTDGVQCDTDDKDGVLTSHGLPDWYALSATFSGATATIGSNPQEPAESTLKDHIRWGVALEVTGTASGACDGIYYRKSGGTSTAFDLADADGADADFSGCASGTVRRLNEFNVLHTDGSRATYPVRITDADTVELVDVESKLAGRTPEYVTTRQASPALSVVSWSHSPGLVLKRAPVRGHMPDHLFLDSAVDADFVDGGWFDRVAVEDVGYAAPHGISGIAASQYRKGVEVRNSCFSLRGARDLQWRDAACTGAMGLLLFADSFETVGETLGPAEDLTWKRTLIHNPTNRFPGAADSWDLTQEGRGFCWEMKYADRVAISGLLAWRPGADFTTPNSGCIVFSPRGGGSDVTPAQTRDIGIEDFVIAATGSGVQINADVNLGEYNNADQDLSERVRLHNGLFAGLNEDVTGLGAGGGQSTAQTGWLWRTAAGVNYSADRITFLDAQADEPHWLQPNVDRVSEFRLTNSVLVGSGAKTVETQGGAAGFVDDVGENDALFDEAYPGNAVSDVDVIGCVEDPTPADYAAATASTDDADTVTPAEMTARAPDGAGVASIAGASCDARLAAAFPTAGSFATASGRGFSETEFLDAMGAIRGDVSRSSPSAGTIRLSYTVRNADVAWSWRAYPCTDAGGSACSTQADWDHAQTLAAGAAASATDGSEDGARSVDITGLTAGLYIVYGRGAHDWRVVAAEASS